MSRPQDPAFAVDTLLHSPDDGRRLDACRAILEAGDRQAVHILHETRRSLRGSKLGQSLDEMLREQGLLVDLGPFVADRWFEGMTKQINGFEEVCDVVGYRFMAFSLIVGVNLKAVMHNPETPSDSTVEFTVTGEDEVREAPMEDFRRMLVTSLTSGELLVPPEVSTPPTRDVIARLVGVKYLLLGPLYGIKLRGLYIVDRALGYQGYTIEFEREGELNEWTLERLREFLRDLVRSERVREPAARGRFSTDDVRLAERALTAGNPERALEHLRDWILFVRNYRLTGTITQLVNEPEEHFARGLMLTGRAYRQMNRMRLSEDLLRFSIQLLPAGPTLPRFYYELALIMIGESRFSEAIGPLRHALGLGLDTERVYPQLGEALLRCDRVVGAAIVLGELNREGLLDADGAKLLEETRRRLGNARHKFEEIAG